MASIIEIENLGMTYKTKIRKGLFNAETVEIEAIRNINLEVEENTIFGILGPNGAGKTTLIKCLTTLLIPTRGTAKINGFDVRTEEKEIRASIGAMLMGERGLYWKLTARENLEYFARLYSLSPNLREKRIDYVNNLLELEEFIDRPVESYSSGQKMKAAFAKALIHDPPILFLDEPTIAMDVHGTRKLKQVVKSLPDEGKTIIYTTHIMQEAQELCDKVAIIDRGEIIALDTPTNMINKSGINHSLHLSGAFNDEQMDSLHSLDIVRHLALTESVDGAELDIIVTNTRKAIPIVTKSLLEKGARIDQISTKDPSLEDVFIKLTGRSLSEDTTEVPT